MARAKRTKRPSPTQKIDGDFIRAEVRRVCYDGKPTEQTDEFLASCVLLASSQVGPNIRRIAKLLGVPRSDKRLGEFSRNLRKSGVWRGGRVAASDWFKKNGGLDFALDSAVAIGWIERIPESEAH